MTALRCWWRMLATKCFADNFELLMTSCLEILKMILGKFFQSLESLPVETRRRRTTLSVSLFRFGPYLENPVRCLSTIRILSVFSVWYLSGVCLSQFCPLSGFYPNFLKKLSVVCLSDWTRTRQRYPDIRYFARSRLFWLDSLNSNMWPPYIAPNNPNWLFISHWMATWWQLDRVETANLLFETS